MIEDFFESIYSKLGYYFTGSDRTRPLYATLIVIFIAIHWLTYFFKVTTDTEMMYIVFSSLVQALLSLVALLGAVSMFQIDRKKVMSLTLHLRGGFTTIFTPLLSLLFQ